MRKITLLLALLIVAAGCNKSETAAPPTTTSQATPTVTAAPTPQPTQTSATTASAAPAAGAIANSDGEQAGVHIEVTEFKRTSGNTVTLKFVLSNSGNSTFKMWGANMGDAAVHSDYKSVGGIHLVDPVNKKKYFVVRDAEQKCLCSNEVEDVHAGGRVNLWAKFPAPPSDVQKLTIEIPHFQPMDDVSISQ